MHDPTISAEGNRFLFIGFQPQGAWQHICSEPCSPMRPSTSLAPHQAISQNHAQKCPISFSVLKTAAQTGLHPLWKELFWVTESTSFHRSSPLQDLGYLSSVSMQWFRETCAVLHWIMVESKAVHIPREWLLHMSFREAEVCSSAFPVRLQTPPTNLGLVRQVPGQLHQLFPYTLSSCMAAFSLQTAWNLPPYYPRPQGRKKPFPLGPPLFQMLVRNFVRDLMYGLSYDVLLMPVPPYILPSLAAIFSERKNSSLHRGICLP